MGRVFALVFQNGPAKIRPIMACPNSPCSSPPIPENFDFVGDPNAARFCDARLIGLAPSDASQGTTLTALDTVTGCLSQPQTIKGSWQHNPDNCGGPDYVGPLDAPEFSNIPAADATKSHWPAYFETTTGCAVDPLKLVKMLPAASNTGFIHGWQRESCPSSGKPVSINPQLLGAGKQNTGGNCVSPKMLGYIKDSVTLTGGEVIDNYTWYSLDQWQQAVVDPVVDADLIDAEDPEDIKLSLAFWREEGCTNGSNKVKKLIGANWTQVKRLLGIGDPVIFEPWEEVYLQHKSVGPITGISYFPSVNTPGALPVVANPDFPVDLTLLPGYLPSHKTVRLHIHCKSTTISQHFDAGIAINGKEYARNACAADSASNDNQNTVEIPIPDDGILHINNFYQIAFAGNVGSHLAVVYVLALLP